MGLLGDRWSFSGATRSMLGFGIAGFGHMGLDFSPGPKYERGLYGRWPGDGGYPERLLPLFVTWPGPNGAEPMSLTSASVKDSRRRGNHRGFQGPGQEQRKLGRI